MRFGFLGTEGPLAGATLAALLEAGANPDSVIALGLAPSAPSRPSPLALAPSTSLVTLAAAADIALRHCPTSEADIAALLASMAPTPSLMVVACLPVILHRATFETTQYGFINVHPSLLPAFRGPQPAFWQLQAGLTRGGVSVHQIDAGVDTGKVLLQQSYDIEAGATEQTLDQRAGATAGALLAQNLGDWPPAQPPGTQPPSPQVPAASYQGAPGAQAYQVDARTWTAERAYRFIRGTAWRGVPYEIAGEGWRARVAQALEIRASHRSVAARAQGQTCTLPFCDTDLTVRGELIQGQ